MIARFRRLPGVLLAALLLLGPALPALGAPALWRVEGEGAPLFLFGSFHLLPRDADWRSAEFRAAFDRARRIVYEIPTDGAAQTEIKALILAHGINPEDSPLSVQLPQEHWSEIEAYARSIGLTPLVLEQARPWYASLLLTVQFMVTRGLDPAAGVDVETQLDARADGKALAFLETPAEQIGIFTGLPLDAQKVLLIETVRELAKTGGMTDAMLEAWLAGDVEGLETLVNGSLKAFPELHERVLLARNLRWVERLEDLADDGVATMVIVGAGHLVGEGSVIDLLRARGHVVVGP